MRAATCETGSPQPEMGFKWWPVVVFLAAAGLLGTYPAFGATRQGRYYAYETSEDPNGVIAAWYKGQNGQLDFRARIAAETLKRYPWTDTSRAIAAAPEYVFNGAWSIAADGAITVPALKDWDNGDWGQRAAYVLSALTDYYRYSGDPAAIAHVTVLADALLDYCQTPPDHPWASFLISVPVKGKPYGLCDPHGMIQLDIVAEVGLALVRAYELTGNERWLNATKHWADVLADKRNADPRLPPWNRYANPEEVAWEDPMTGGVAFLLTFFDALIRIGYEGEQSKIIEARETGRQYLRDVLLPRWTVDDTWGRNYWDWPDPVQAENVTEFVVRYLMEHQDYFPNWRNDARNILSLFLHRTSVSPDSRGDVYSGAWAFPESSGCCGRSLWYGPMELAPVWAEYGVLTGSEWAREIARRMQILATYDCHESGVVEDNIDGGQVVAGGWFKIAHPMALKHVLGTIAWLPEIFGANRENHIVRSSAVVSNVLYEKGRITYSTYDAPSNTADVLRLSFSPASVTMDTAPLSLRSDLEGNGYCMMSLSNRDCILTIRHDAGRDIVVVGEDPQEVVAGDRISFGGNWQAAEGNHVASEPGASAACSFTGNQVRVIGGVGPAGGLADVYLDHVKQLVGIDYWNPGARQRQVLYYRNRLANGEHTLKVVARGAANPLSRGRNVYIDSVQYSAATGESGLGEGGGPNDPQRMIFGFTGREDYVDTAGNSWKPATEFVVRAGGLADAVASSWWTARRRLYIGNASDPELYRYGVHAREFWVNLTVAPGAHYVRLKFAETRTVEPKARAVTITINGTEMVADLDIAATAGGLNKAVDLVFNDIRPQHGTIEVRLCNRHNGEAILQALEVGPGNGGTGANPVCLPQPPPANP